MMMKASLYSGDGEMLRYEESEDERRITLCSFLEMFHYIIPAYRFFRFARAMEKDERSYEGRDLEVEELMDSEIEMSEDGSGEELSEAGNRKEKKEKPLRLKAGFLNIRLD